MSRPRARGSLSGVHYLPWPLWLILTVPLAGDVALLAWLVVKHRKRLWRRDY